MHTAVVLAHRPSKYMTGSCALASLSTACRDGCDGAPSTHTLLACRHLGAGPATCVSDARAVWGRRPTCPRVVGVHSVGGWPGNMRVEPWEVRSIWIFTTLCSRGRQRVSQVSGTVPGPRRCGGRVRGWRVPVRLLCRRCRCSRGAGRTTRASGLTESPRAGARYSQQPSPRTRWHGVRTHTATSEHVRVWRPCCPGQQAHTVCPRVVAAHPGHPLRLFV